MINNWFIPRGLPLAASLLYAVTLAGCAPRSTEKGTMIPSAHELKADSLLQRGFYWKALPYYQDALESTDVSITPATRNRIHARLYEVFYDAREWDSAFVYAESLRATPWFDSLPNKGLVYFRAGEFERILGIADASPLLRAEAASRLGLEDSAQVLYAEAERLLGEVARGRRAEVYAALGNKDSALVLLKKLKYPSETQKRLLVNLLFEKKAYRDLPEAIARLASESERQQELVRLYGEVGDNTKKRRAQMRLIRAAPGSWGAREAASEMVPKDAEETFALAKVYAGTDAEKALRMYEEAEAKGYSRSSCRWERAQLLYRLKRYDEARWLLEGMTSDEARFLLAKVETDRGRTDEAMAILADIARSSESAADRQEAWERQATILQRQKRNREAAELAARGARELGDNQLAHRALVLWLAEGDTANARKAMSNGLPLDPDVSVFFRIWLCPDSADALLSNLSIRDPFSYYTLSVYGKLLPMSDLETWFVQLGDTSRALSARDSILEYQAFALAEAGFPDEASRKLRGVNNPSLPVLYSWAKMFSDLGEDNLGIYWVEQLLSQARKRGVRTRPLEVTRLLFPTSYMLQVQKNIDEPALFMALTHQESWFNPKARSPANAYGLCQLLYSTARSMDSTITVDSLYVPQTSIRLGARFLVDMRERFAERKVVYLSAYNAGPGAAKRWTEYLPSSDVLFVELIPYDETRNYVKRILRNEIVYQTLLGFTGD